METGFSRFPVVGSDGSLEGYIHTKDILAVPAQARDEVFDASIVHSLGRVPEDAKLQAVMRRMQATQAHLALVESSGDGGQNQRAIVALEDVLEELVGEVRDATTPETA